MPFATAGASHSPSFTTTCGTGWSASPLAGLRTSSFPHVFLPCLRSTGYPRTSDARELRQPTGDTGRPVEHAEATDRDVHETGCRPDSGEQVRLKVVVEGLLGLERVH